ncbi:MAG: sodium:proton antiporter [Endomicrobiales bacterium]|nr:sodium:proton antiporter [Endomicrobiales bacterium]
MSEHALLGFAVILILGISAQWFSWFLRIPTIVVLLVLGAFAGPFTGLLDPDLLFGNALLPFVSISVAIILFEGGLSLRLKDLKKSGGVIRNLITVGALVTMFIAAFAAIIVLGLDWRISSLLGALLVVSGPTVIIPLLRQVKPDTKITSILKWEGIIIDPIGAILTVLVFEALFIHKAGFAPLVMLTGAVKILFIGLFLSFIFAGIIVILLKRYWIPDYLQEVVTLMFIILTYIVSNRIQPESGLLTVTILGILLANQKFIDIKHIVRFKENLRILLISTLFIILAARLDHGIVGLLNLNSLLFLIILIFLVRPVAVFLSTIGSGLSYRERIFISFVAPRGIVAAAIGSLFSLRLAQLGISDTGALVSYTFLVIIATVIFYGVISGPLAGFLKVKANMLGILFVGAHEWSRRIAHVFHKEGISVILADSSRENIQRAKMEGLNAYHCNILSSDTIEELEFEGIGKVLALTPNDEVNRLAVQHFNRIIEKKDLFLIQPEAKPYIKSDDKTHWDGTHLFGKEMTYREMSNLFRSGYEIKTTKLTKEFDYKSLLNEYGNKIVPLFILHDSRDITPETLEKPLSPTQDQKLVFLAPSKT